MDSVAHQLRLRPLLCAGRVFPLCIWWCCLCTTNGRLCASYTRATLRCNVGPRPPYKIAKFTLTIKLDRNWSSFQRANSAPPLSALIALLPLPQGCCVILRSVSVAAVAAGARVSVTCCVLLCACACVLLVVAYAFALVHVCCGFLLGPRAPHKFRKSH